MAVRPVKFISDVLTKKQILKTDIDNNTLFSVSGSLLEGGHVSSSLPITASNLFIDGNAYISGTLHAKRMHVTEVTTSVYYEDSISASINALYDVSASNASIGNTLVWNGENWAADNYDLKVSGAIDGTLQIINNIFASSSNMVVDYFNPDGSKLLTFNNYGAADIEYLSVDIMVMVSGTNIYTNDLISVGMFINNSGTLSVQINAGSLNEKDKFKLLLNKQINSIL